MNSQTNPPTQHVRTVLTPDIERLRDIVRELEQFVPNLRTVALSGIKPLRDGKGIRGLVSEIHEATVTLLDVPGMGCIDCGHSITWDGFAYWSDRMPPRFRERICPECHDRRDHELEQAGRDPEGLDPMDEDFAHWVRLRTILAPIYPPGWTRADEVRP